MDIICTYHVYGLLLQTAVLYNVYLCTCIPKGLPISPAQSREGKNETQLDAIHVYGAPELCHQVLRNIMIWMISGT